MRRGEVKCRSVTVKVERVEVKLGRMERNKSQAGKKEPKLRRKRETRPAQPSSDHVIYKVF
jgi:hypothetical protein